MTMAVEKDLAIGYLLLALRTVKTIKAFKQPSTCINDDPSSSGYVPLPHKKQRGRPPLQSTLRMQALMASKPDYAKSSPYFHLGLSEKSLDESFQLIRKSYGLHHKAYPNNLVIYALAVDEGPDPECEAKNPNARTYADLQKRTAADLMEVKANISNASKKKGQKVHAKTQRSQIEKEAPEILQALATKRITPEAAQTRLRNLPVVIPIPTVRSLRRMAQQKRGQEPAPK
jgi:hypothetical protein